MNRSVKKLILALLPFADILLFPFVIVAAWLLKNIRHAGVENLPFCKRAFMWVGVFPIRNHYYEPQFDHRALKQPLSQDRILPGVDWNVDEQLDLLSNFSRGSELEGTPLEKTEKLEFYVNNGAFGPGDADYWYQLIRQIKPKRIFEVGSGNSTLMGVRAIQKNKADDPAYSCKHVCIEPYEMPWLEELGVSVLRQKIEDVDLSFFSELEEGDILFIDSSHIIRPQGDVLFEYLELLPVLNKGVIVHVHDIFSPKNYPADWVVDEVKFWNEQYLLEAFLTNNSNWKIIGALSFLHHKHYRALKPACPFLGPENIPGSFYMQKIN